VNCGVIRFNQEAELAFYNNLPRSKRRDGEKTVQNIEKEKKQYRNIVTDRESNQQNTADNFCSNECGLYKAFLPRVFL